MRRIAVTLASFCFPAALSAQSPEPSLTVAGSAAYVVPVGPVATYLAPGWGLNGVVAWEWPGRALGLRVAASYVSFPFAEADHPYSSPPFPAPLYVSTGRTQVAVTAGPDLTLRRGRLLGVVRAGAGLAHTTTVMAGDSLGVDDRYTRRKEYSDLAILLDVGLGAGLRLGKHARLGGAVSYATLGPTQYGLEGTVKVGVISGPYWHPAKQWSSYWTYQLGVSLE